MSSRSCLVHRALLAIPFVAGCIALDASATVLTFERTPQFQFGNQGALWRPVAQGGWADYGDNAVSATQLINDARGVYTYHYGITGGPTPNVVADYEHFGSIGFANDGGTYAYDDGGYPSTGDGSVLFPYFITNQLWRMITLTADPGYAVTLESFEIHSFVGDQSVGYLAVIGIDESNTETVLWSVGSLANNAAAVAVPGATGASFDSTDFGTLTAHGLAIEYRPFSGGHNNFGFDDVQFSQSLVPEPATLAFLAMGAAPLLRRRV